MCSQKMVNICLTHAATCAQAQQGKLQTPVAVECLHTSITQFPVEQLQTPTAIKCLHKQLQLLQA